MKTSDSINAISKALVQAQRNIKFAIKDSTNPHFKSRYADLGSVIDAVKPALNEAGIAFLQTASASEAGFISLTTRLIHESGEWIEDTANCPLQKNDAQGVGSCMSYLRRYNLSSICGLYQDDDDGESTRMNPEDYIKKINESKTIDELQKNYATIISEVRNNKAVAQAVINETSKLKKILQGEQDDTTRPLN
jgi:hypothetical protein